jgi:aminomethyltransferase
LSADPLRTPLYDRHRESGARLVSFAGFSMPVLYTSIVEEHRAVRGALGLFDVSHMGEAWIRGPDALTLAQKLFTNGVTDLSEGRVRYGLFCQEDGGAIDDVTLFRTGPREVFFCLNAANTQVDVDWIRSVREREGLDCEVLDQSADTALLALQGPLAPEVVGRLLAPDSELPRPWRFDAVRLANAPVLLSRTGYTGEDGFEIFVGADRAVSLWDAIRAEAGAELALCGLGARDTLRTEMAYPLYGHELDRTRSPIEAGLERFCAFGSGFIGEEALVRLRENGTRDRRVGLRLEGRAVARPGFPILEGARVGTVTSGTFGPSIERSIAMGYVPAEYAEFGTRLAVEIRGRGVPCEVVRTPFYDRKR